MESPVGLDAWASELWKQLPSAPEVSVVSFDHRSLPRPPATLESPGLVIRRGFHDYGSYRVDYPQWYADKRTYGCLGLLILASEFHRPGDVTVRLTHAQSEITELVVRSDAPAYALGLPELKLAPLEFTYCPAVLRRHPWVLEDLHPDELPFFDLTNERDIAVSDEERADRDVLRGFGSIAQAVRFASLLLDFSRPENPIGELALEGDAGFRGVARASAEVRLWLPGSDGWVDWNAS